MNNRDRNVWELRDKVERYRRLARSVTDSQTQIQILRLTDELEEQARRIETDGKSRSAAAPSRPTDAAQP